MQICRYCKTSNKPFKKLYKQLLKFVQLKVPSVTEKDIFCEKCFLSLENRYKKFKEYKKRLRDSNSLTSHSTETISSPELPVAIASSQEPESQTQGFKSFKSFSVSSESIGSDPVPKKLSSSNGSNLLIVPKQTKYPTKKSTLNIEKVLPIVPRREVSEELIVSSSSSTNPVKVTTKAIVHSIKPSQQDSAKVKQLTKVSNVTTRITDRERLARLVDESPNQIVPIINREEVSVQPIVNDSSDMEEVEYEGSDDDIFDPAIPLPNIQPHVKKRKVIRSKNEPLNWSYKTGG